MRINNIDSISIGLKMNLTAHLNTYLRQDCVRHRILDLPKYIQRF